MIHFRLAFELRVSSKLAESTSASETDGVGRGFWKQKEEYNTGEG